MGKVKTTPSGPSVVLDSSTDVVQLSTADAVAAPANAASKSFAWPNGITPDDQLTVSAPSFTGNQTVTISSGANPPCLWRFGTAQCSIPKFSLRTAVTKPSSSKYERGLNSLLSAKRLMPLTSF